jgi:GAF domain-containing protein/HAMP domain-containing protein
MTLYKKILLISFLLVVITAVVVSLLAFLIARASIHSTAQDSLISYLENAIVICSRQVSALQAEDITEPDKVAEAKAAALEELKTATFGETGYIMAVDATGFIISNPRKSSQQLNISSEPWFSSLQNKSEGSFTFSWDGKERLAHFYHFQDWGWYLISSKTESELLGSIDRLRNNLGILLAFSLLAAFIAILISSRWLTTPLRVLLAGAQRIIGDESTEHINLKTNDEVGTLAQAFNNLAEKLREAGSDQEQRITAHAHDLEQRIVQLQSASEIAQLAASTHEVNTLLDLSVNLIQERFGLYHASIYTPDEPMQYAILRTGAGEVGKQMVQRGYRVRIGEVGIVSYVLGTGEPRVVNDVNKDFTYVKHPLLPDTVCEAALPLKARDRIIGVLDLESQHLNFFNQDMLAVLQPLAEQLAVAIENARSLEELRSSLSETRSQNQQYTQESWAQATKGNRISGYQYDLSEITAYTRNLPDEMRTRLLSGRAIPIRDQHSAESERVQKGITPGQPVAGNRSVLLAPLILYEQLIGILGVEDDNPDHIWSIEEIALVEAISNQVSLTLDNARLVEETQLRSEQIRLLQEITAVAASHVNLNELLDAVTKQLLTGYNLLHCGVALLDKKAGHGEEPGGVKQSPESHLGATSTMVAYVSAPDAPGANLVGARIPITEDKILQQMLNTHKAVAVYRTQEKDLSKPTLVMVPLLTRGELFGTIKMEVADPTRQFGEDDLKLLEQIGLQISAAIEVAQSFEQTTNRAERERIIGEMTSRIRETLDVETMVKTAVKEVQQVLRLPEVVIRLGLPSTQASTTGAEQPGFSTPLTGEKE